MGDEANEARESSAIVVGAETHSRGPHTYNTTREGHMTKQDKPQAVNIYERQDMDAEGQGGSVQDDIADMDLDEMMDYFGDLDPIEFL
jgi:hypothetical protein